MQHGPATEVYSGHMKLVDVPYDQKLEDTTSKEFNKLADDLEEIVSLTPNYFFFGGGGKRRLTFLSIVSVVCC